MDELINNFGELLTNLGELTKHLGRLDRNSLARGRWQSDKTGPKCPNKKRGGGNVGTGSKIS